jgi:antitoxin (DNA-binding transcriptional repressor) of toxin-antitoxin stability system
MPPLDARDKYSYMDSRISKGPDVTVYSVAEAKNTLPKLIDRALQGEEVVITRHGKPVAELRAVQPPAAPGKCVLKWLRARTLARPSVGLTSVEILDLVYEPKED